MEIGSLNIIQWIRLGVAIFMSIGPGLAILSLFSFSKLLDKTQKIKIASGFSLACWPIIFLWLNTFSLPLHPAVVWIICGAGWLISIVQFKPCRSWSGLKGATFVATMPRILLWIVAISSVSIILWQLRHQVAGLGSDSYHHTLIAQMMNQSGKIPSDFLQISPVATFRYHFGYHAFIAILGWLSNIPIILIIPISYAILHGFAVLSIGFLTEIVTKNKYAAVTAGAAVGLAMVFPAVAVNWGRYPQLSGSILLTLFLGVIWLWKSNHYSNRFIFPLSLLAIGLGLTHYRVTFMALIAVVLLFILEVIYSHQKIDAIQQQIKSWTPVVLFSLILSLPWIIHLLVIRNVGFSIHFSPVPNTLVQQLQRISSTLEYPTTIPLLVVAGLGILIGVIKREQFVILLTSWLIVMLFASRIRFFLNNMDIVTVIVSSFVPLSVMIGWTAKLLWEQKLKWLGTIISVLLLGALVIFGLRSLNGIVRSSSAIVYPQDLKAAQWIRENTPSDAYFMINTFHWDWNPEYIVSWDAGGWLPVIADRKVITSPMFYPIEGISVPDYKERLLELHAISTDLASDEAIQILKSEGITYIYLGYLGGIIDPNKLFTSPNLVMIYHEENVYIFKIL